MTRKTFNEYIIENSLKPGMVFKTLDKERRFRR